MRATSKIIRGKWRKNSIRVGQQSCRNSVFSWKGKAQQMKGKHFTNWLCCFCYRWLCTVLTCNSMFPPFLLMHWVQPQHLRSCMPFCLLSHWEKKTLLGQHCWWCISPTTSTPAAPTPQHPLQADFWSSSSCTKSWPWDTGHHWTYTVPNVTLFFFL